jgi:hypothetical protein
LPAVIGQTSQNVVFAHLLNWKKVSRFSIKIKLAQLLFASNREK